MVPKPEVKPAQPPTAGAPLPVASAAGPIDEQKNYLVNKIDELVNGIGPGYAEALTQELMARMERTVALFHDEVMELIGSLKGRRAEREQRLQSILASGDGEPPQEQSAPAPEPAREISAWEQRLEEREGAPEAGPEVSSAEKEMSDWEKKLEEKARKDSPGSDSRGAAASVAEKPKRRGLFGRKQ